MVIKSLLISQGILFGFKDTLKCNVSLNKGDNPTLKLHKLEPHIYAVIATTFVCTKTTMRILMRRLRQTDITMDCLLSGLPVVAIPMEDYHLEMLRNCNRGP